MITIMVLAGVALQLRPSFWRQLSSTELGALEVLAMFIRPLRIIAALILMGTGLALGHSSIPRVRRTAAMRSQGRRAPPSRCPDNVVELGPFTAWLPQVLLRISHAPRKAKAFQAQGVASRSSCPRVADVAADAQASHAEPGSRALRELRFGLTDSRPSNRRRHWLGDDVVGVPFRTCDLPTEARCVVSLGRLPRNTPSRRFKQTLHLRPRIGRKVLERIPVSLPHPLFKHRRFDRRSRSDALPPLDDGGFTALTSLQVSRRVRDGEYRG